MKLARRAPYNWELILFERWRVRYAPAYGWRALLADVWAAMVRRTPPFGYPSEVCCGSTIYWCPRSRSFECATHGGHDTCCDHPERHTPLHRFGVQAEALLKWSREQRNVVVPGTAENSKRALRAHQAGVPVSLDHDTGEWTVEPRTGEEWAEWGDCQADEVGDG